MNGLNKAVWSMLIVAGFVVGCKGNAAEREAKREHDRTMMRLSDAESQRDAYKAQADQLRADVTSSQKRVDQAQADLTDSTSRLKKAQDDLSAARLGQADADKTAVQLKAAQSDLATAQKQLADLQSQNAKLQSDLTAAKAQLKNAATPPSTQPMLNK